MCFLELRCQCSNKLPPPNKHPTHSAIIVNKYHYAETSAPLVNLRLSMSALILQL